jgi:hypothetical protein
MVINPFRMGFSGLIIVELSRVTAKNALKQKCIILSTRGFPIVKEIIGIGIKLHNQGNDSAQARASCGAR